MDSTDFGPLHFFRDGSEFVMTPPLLSFLLSGTNMNTVTSALKVADEVTVVVAE